MNAAAPATIEVHDLGAEHVDDVIRIDARYTGERKPDYWKRVFRDFLGRHGEPTHVGLAAIEGQRLIGYLLGEVRAFEFGSEACGWIFAVGVDPLHGRRGVASALLAECAARFRAAGVDRVRTMVRRNAVDVLSFFRVNGFEGGSFVQLERQITEEG